MESKGDGDQRGCVVQTDALKSAADGSLVVGLRDGARLVLLSAVDR